MSWRVVVVSGRCKLEYKLGYLVCRGEETKKVFMCEINTLIVESTAVSLTAALLTELTKAKVNVIFCDEKHNPQTQLFPFFARHDSSGIIKKQIAWKKENQERVWTEIVRQKILQQYKFLQELESEQAELLKLYVDELQVNDLSNREGHSAKVYFNVLFGLNFKRGDNTFINGALNYGYAILLSAFNREIVGCGYNTAIGINHKNEFNHFNLSCDFIEPFRVIVDRFVFSSEEEEMSFDYKHTLCNLLNRKVKIDGGYYVLTDAIGIYCKSVFQALETGDVLVIKGYEL